MYNRIKAKSNSDSIHTHYLITLLKRSYQFPLSVRYVHQKFMMYIGKHGFSA